MSTELTWLGHASFSLLINHQTVLIDPYLDDSPTSPVKAGDVTADFILVSHGHFDHVTDVVPIAKRTGAMVVANHEICEWLKVQGIAEDKVSVLNPGGSEEFPFGRVKMTVAHHSSSMPDGSYGGVAGGFVLDLSAGRIYFAGDTGLFLDMKLIGIGGLDLAVLPIGDKFTMGPDDSLEAIKFLNPTRVIPCHYNTWPPIEQDVAGWADHVRSQTSAEPIALEPGGKFSL